MKASDEGDTLIPGTDYSLGWSKDGDAMLNVLTGGALESATDVFAQFYAVDPTLVDANDIIGGYNAVTKKYEGLELINSIFNKYRLVIGEIVVPKWGEDPAVAAVIYAKANSVSGVFKAMALVDIPADEDGIRDYSDAPEYKNQKNLVYDKQIVFWPKIQLGEDLFSMSVQAAGLMGKVDAENGGVPVDVFSNHNLQMDACVLDDGEEVSLDLMTQGNYLNGEGITTAVNFIGGWRAWGVQCASYPANTDIKDSMINVRRMFNWIGNTIILTYWQKLDKRMIKRNIETVIDSLQIWLNGLASREYLVGHPSIAFREQDNPATDLLAGIARFHVKVTPAPAMKEMEFILEYDVDQLSTLFSASE